MKALERPQRFSNCKSMGNFQTLKGSYLRSAWSNQAAFRTQSKLYVYSLIFYLSVTYQIQLNIQIYSKIKHISYPVHLDLRDTMNYNMACYKAYHSSNNMYIIKNL